MYTAAELALLRAMDPNPLVGIDPGGGKVGDLSPPTKSPDSFSTSAYAPIRYVPLEHELLINQRGAVLNGFNFNDVLVAINAPDVTIENCTFTAGANQYYTLQQTSNATRALIENNTFNGGSAADPLPLEAFITSQGATISVLNNRFLNAPADGVDLNGGTISGNYFSGAGFSSWGVHPDAIWVSDSKSRTLISNNFIDETFAEGATSLANGEANDAIRITAETGPASNITVTKNVLLGGNWVIDSGNGLKNNAGQPYTSSSYTNINISGNYIGFGFSGDFMYGPRRGTTLSNNTIVDFSNQIYSKRAWAAYVPWTNNVIPAAAAGDNIMGVQGPTAGSTTLYGNSTGEGLFGSRNVTVFVGGGGEQYMHGGSGPNIFTELAFSDSPDLVGSYVQELGNVNPSKDVFDLSRIDADPATPGQQHFTFIGSHPLSSAGGQVQVTQANNWTDINVTMAGSSRIMMKIAINGSVNLTAANFALTAAQSNLLKGDSTSYSLSGKMIGSTAFLADGTENLFGASASGLSSAGPQLASATPNPDGSGTLSLLANNLTISSSSHALGLSAAGNTFTLTRHTVETIQAAGNSGEAFVYTPGFGSSDIVGFQASGANDQIQLQASMFSGLTVGQSTTDWQKLLTSDVAVQSGADVIINDAAGDALRLSGVTLSSLTANAASIFKFA
jgi:hypothetical protein